MYYALLLLASCIMVAVLFGSAGGVVVWMLRRFVGVAAGSDELAERPHRLASRVDQWDPDHPLFSRRAGQ
jgi:hypothetical protein